MAQPVWAAEHSVGRERAGALIAAQFPELRGEVAGRGVEAVGSGWDVEVWRVGEWAFRFPRRKLGIEALENELRALPALAGALPVAIPEPRWIGKPSAEFPAPFYGHRYLEGRTADRAALSDGERTALAKPLGRFLRALHGLAAARGGSGAFERDTFRFDTELAASRALERSGALLGGTHRALAAAARERVARAPAPLAGDAALLHGDLYARQLLLGEASQLSAVIDWGDVCLGDPAVDLSVAFTFLPPEARESFFEEYGGADGAARERARHFGLCRYGLSLLAYALDVGDAGVEREAARALETGLS